MIHADTTHICIWKIFPVYIHEFKFHKSSCQSTSIANAEQMSNVIREAAITAGVRLQFLGAIKI